MYAVALRADRLLDEDTANVYDILRKGLNDLSDLCEAVEEKFTEARDEFKRANPRVEE